MLSAAVHRTALLFIAFGALRRCANVASCGPVSVTPVQQRYNHGNSGSTTGDGWADNATASPKYNSTIWGHYKFANDKVVSMRVLSKAWKKHASSIGDSKSDGKQKQRMLNQQPFTPVPLRFHVVWQLDGLNATAQGVLKDMVASATETMSRILKLRYPAPNPFLVTPRCAVQRGLIAEESCLKVDPDVFTGEATSCKWLNFDPGLFGPFVKCTGSLDCSYYDMGSSGVLDTDLVLYVSAVEYAYGSDLAVDCSGQDNPIKAIRCQLVDVYGRDQLLNLNICPKKLLLDPAQFDKQTELMVQALFMGMGFHPRFTRFWMNTTLNRRGLKNWAVAAPSPFDSTQTVTWLSSPAVQREARRHYACADIIGMPLEDEADLDLWEYRVAQGDLMASGPPMDGSRPVLSRISLAVIEDTGHYLVDYAYAGHLEWGWQAGCRFINGTCPQAMINASFPWFCSLTSGSGIQCSSNYKSVGTCANETRLWGSPNTKVNLTNGCGVVAASKGTPNCMIPGSIDADITELPFWNYGSKARCLPVEYPLINAEVIIAPKAVNTTVTDYYCLNINCSLGLCVNTSGQSMVCPEGSFINLTTYFDGFQAGAIGPCPAQSQVCRTVCSRSCNEPYGGICVAEKCYCYLGYTGENCSERYWLGAAPTLSRSNVATKSWKSFARNGTAYPSLTFKLAPTLYDRVRHAKGWLITGAVVLGLDLLLLGLICLFRNQLSRIFHCCMVKESGLPDLMATNMDNSRRDAPAELNKLGDLYIASSNRLEPTLQHSWLEDASRRNMHETRLRPIHAEIPPQPQQATHMTASVAANVEEIPPKCFSQDYKLETAEVGLADFSLSMHQRLAAYNRYE